MQRTAQQINNHLKQAQKVLFVSHANPDADTLGSATALAEYLQLRGAHCQLFCVTPAPYKLSFLPNIHLLKHDKTVFSNHSFDTIVVVDCGDLRYAGVADVIYNHPARVINIDHHQTNERFGHINLVIPTAASTTEIIYQFCKINGIRINPNMATSLLSGLVTDTDNFFNPATSDQALTVGSELLRLGANWNIIHQWLVKNKSINTLKAWGVILSRLTKKEETDTAYTYLTIKDMMQYGINDEDAEGISNFLNKLDGAKVSLFLKETSDGKIKGSFRTTSDDVDVSALAKQMGGGGHKKAAGFTTEGTVEDVMRRVSELQSSRTV